MRKKKKVTVEYIKLENQNHASMHTLSGNITPFMKKERKKEIDTENHK